MSTERTARIEEEAADWLIRRDSCRWTEGDQAALEQWLSASTLHRVAYLRLESAWEQTQRLQALGAGVPGNRPPAPGQWSLGPFFVPSASTTPHRSSSRGRQARFAVAAGLLLCMLAALGSYWVPAGERYATAVGAMASVPIVDGSKIILNTNTRIRVEVSATQRSVELTQGEAYFEVAQDKQRPFVVHVGPKQVTAVGTKFSVRRDGDEVEVIVTDGRVRMDTQPPLSRNRGEPASSAAPQSGSQRSASTDGMTTTQVLLTAGAIARAAGGSILIQRKSLAEAEDQLSWRSGVLRFRDATLAAAVAEFNRYNVRKIIIKDPAVAALRIEGNFRPTNLDAFVRLLEEGFSLQARSGDTQIVLTAK